LAKELCPEKWQILFQNRDLNLHLVNLDLLTVGMRGNITLRCPAHTTCDRHVYKLRIRKFFGKKGNQCPWSGCRTNTDKICECHEHERLLKFAHPDLFLQIDYEKSGISCDRVSTGTDRYLYWHCLHPKKQHPSFRMRPRHRILGHGCPRCKRSKMEETACNHFSQYTIPFQEQFRFRNIKEIKDLKFDLYFPDLKLLIELDGEQHFRPKFGKKSRLQNFLEQRRRDKLKNYFASYCGYSLLRISHEVKLCHIVPIIIRFMYQLAFQCSRPSTKYVGHEYVAPEYLELRVAK
jgi:very-short-patch-repair endonuclease